MGNKETTYSKSHIISLLAFVSMDRFHVPTSSCWCMLPAGTESKSDSQAHKITACRFYISSFSILYQHFTNLDLFLFYIVHFRRFLNQDDQEPLLYICPYFHLQVQYSNMLSGRHAT